MRQLAAYAGEENAFAELVREALTGRGFSMVRLGEPCDVLIDDLSRSPSEVQALAQLSHPARHYVLISSHHVYPPSSPLRPWRVEDVDVTTDLPGWGTPELVAAREREREARLIQAGRSALTILRPAGRETGAHGRNGRITAHFLARIQAHGAALLPEGNLPQYRFAADRDLAAAIATVALRKAAFGKTLNVANPGVLTYWGHAALVRDATGRPLRFAYVPSDQWRESGLELPGLTDASTAFIETSEELRDWGWTPVDPIAQMLESVRALVEAVPPLRDDALSVEHSILASLDASREGARTYMHPVPVRNSARQWRLDAWSGQLDGLSVKRFDQPHQLPTPIVRVRKLALHAAEEKFLRGEYRQSGRRALGHSALLELLTSQGAGLSVGSLALPMATMPCADPDCRFCRGDRHGVIGIGCDGYGWGVCSTPESHLVPVPAELADVALLAEPLACLTHGLCDERWRADQRPVWIAGRTVEAALASWIAQECGRHVVHVDRVASPHDEFPTLAVDAELERVRAGEIEAPTLAFDFTGAADVSWPLANALASDGHLFAHRRPPGIPHARHWHIMPPAAWSKAMLQAALDRLSRWQGYRDLTRRIGRAIPLENSWEVFLPTPFALSFIEGTQP